MDNIKLEMFDGIAKDSLSGETIQKGIFFESGARNIFIGINTIVKIIDFINQQGGILPKMKDN